MAVSGAVALLASVVAVIGLASATGAADALGSEPSAAPAAEVATAPAEAGTPFIKVVTAQPARPETTRHPAARSPGATPAAATSPSTPCATGRWQHDIERDLDSLGGYGAVTVDGRQSPGDCATIRAFQHRFGIRPAGGQADATTADVARRITASSTPERRSACGAAAQVTACVDLTLQTVWVMRGSDVVAGPTVIRSGFRGHATPAGTYRINKRAQREWSDPYAVWLPYWQRFVGGIGFHETTTYLHDARRGSHGCVNLLHDDAVAMFDLLDMGATVRTFGRRPGT
ncbi:L,D-transpeptidase [Actinoplanes sp. NEAU-A12]|uniref:L,D-transpeptidase n=1 Tax=Actinoplanes sandaracinus TaxID=3045177 RepID=A0ABT6WNP4_9ACTN|nr:L,D-transpeptidase [Actinoplanes sandaracinus]MDI6101396.1 L,D-transpeptidase [Actinoplanes sandaracinus]